MTWNNLPTEILEIVFGILKDKEKTLMQCELVCKNWKMPAQRAVYKRVYLRKESKAIQLIDAVKKNPTLGDHVRYLSYKFPPSVFSWLRDEDQHITYMGSFAKCFPFLEQLSSETTDSYYIRLLFAHSDSRLQNLKVIDRISEEEQIGIYATCCLEYRKTLTFLLLWDKYNIGISEDEVFYTEDYNRLASRLDEFPCLTDMEVTKHSHKSLEAVIGPILETCSLVKAIRFYVCPPVEEYPPIRTDIDLSHFTPRLTQFEDFTGAAPIDNDSTLLYIMHTFPKMKSLEVNFEQDMDSYDHIYTVLNSFDSTFTMPVLAKFLHYLTTTVETYYIDYFYTEVENIPDLIAEFWALLPPGELQSLNLMYGLRFEEFIKHGPGKLNAKISMQSDDSTFWGFLMRKHNMKGPCINYKAIANIMPHLCVLERNGHLVGKLKFGGAGSIQGTVTEDSARYMANGYYFDHIFKHCSNLKKLVIENVTLSSCDPDMCVSDSVTDLSFIRMSKLRQGALSEISVRLPQLENFKLDCCKFLDDSDTEQKKNTIIDMETTSFKKLSIVVDCDGYDIKKLCVKLTTSAKRTQYYKLALNKKANKHETTKGVKRDYDVGLNSRNCACFSINCDVITTLELKVKEGLACVITI